ncbi:MAG TPA: hypothetical protein VHZ32_08965 [Rhizomicrobium sp.]|nr:hypothetical protein [Rhizomicrobium sp.]
MAVIQRRDQPGIAGELIGDETSADGVYGIALLMAGMGVFAMAGNAFAAELLNTGLGRGGRRVITKNTVQETTKPPLRATRGGGARGGTVARATAAGST